MKFADVDVNDLSSVEITAGLGGFLVLFALGLAVWFLGRDLSRRLRGMRQRESLRVEAEENKSSAAAQDAGVAKTEPSAESDSDRSSAVDRE
ncbi:hypothetical protein [Ornithinimicrobium sp. INDO-MA30-4]|uniref:hypothetical protein n=1 Tax=Ornithinimicrobium sp. INDO-MA30-4 TaxID=2908651 RepID=UPI001F21DBDF|nr:hypothetical protein [Ornithinimicrobium sp. INDO-MA30-4]UJH70615.1 hypothetical protein L0A91_00275 [Ornithinimicrobium sp. INDO-MA30-4]